MRILSRSCRYQLFNNQLFSKQKLKKFKTFLSKFMNHFYIICLTLLVVSCRIESSEDSQSMPSYKYEGSNNQE